MSDEKKTRQRLTITAMYDAIMDIDVTLVGVPAEHRSIELERDDEDGNKYVATLQRGPDGTVIETAKSEEDFEDAVARLLTRQREKFEEHRKKLLGGLDSVLERHHGALRGARSKIRDKKA